MEFWLGCMYRTLKICSFLLLCRLISTSVPPLASSHRTTHLSLPPRASFFRPVAAWTWHPWLACGAPGRNCPASTKSCSGTCRMSSTRPGTWPSTATSWAARACSLPSSHCSQWSRRISPSYMKVRRVLPFDITYHVATFPFNCLLTERLRPFLKLHVILYTLKWTVQTIQRK